MFKHKKQLLGPLAGLTVILLLAGAIFAPAAQANADPGNGKGDSGKIQNLLPGAQGAKESDKNDGDNDKDDKDNKCKKHKYDGECDFKKPEVAITSPTKNSKTSGSSIIIAGTASDQGSGIKSVQVSVDNHGWVKVPLSSSGTWSISETIKKGEHNIMVKATDNANNVGRAHTEFKITKI